MKPAPIRYHLNHPTRGSVGMWEWYAIAPGHTREWPELRPEIPAHWIYVASFSTQEKAKAYGRRHGWCE